MSRIEEVREEIAWVKFWLGLAAVAAFGLTGWLVTNYQSAEVFLVWLCTAGIVGLVVGILILNRYGVKKIRELRDL